MKRMIGAVLAVFVLWTVMDFVIHGVLLRGLYEASSELWRPEEKMKMPLNFVVVLVFAFVFVYIYAQFVDKKNLAVAFQYGLLLGIGVGVSMGFGTYAFMPVPYGLALGWCVGSVIEITAAGLLLGWILPGSST